MNERFAPMVGLRSCRLGTSRHAAHNFPSCFPVQVVYELKAKSILVPTGFRKNYSAVRCMFSGGVDWLSSTIWSQGFSLTSSCLGGGTDNGGGGGVGGRGLQIERWSPDAVTFSAKHSKWYA